MTNEPTIKSGMGWLAGPGGKTNSVTKPQQSNLRKRPRTAKPSRDIVTANNRAQTNSVAAMRKRSLGLMTSKENGPVKATRDYNSMARNATSSAFENGF